MIKFIVFAYQVWRYINPIRKEIIKICKKAKELGLKNDEARKQVFQDVTDFIQARGLNIPDKILNAGIEFIYQIYVYKKGE